MKAFDSYELRITPLSPIHIGTGDSYEPTNYVIEEDALFEFDTGAAIAALEPSARQELLGITSGKPSEQMLKAVQGFFYQRRQLLAANAVHRLPVLPGVRELYTSRVGRTAQREERREIINRLEIDRTAYNPITRAPVLFGSSLKGAIRTALLDEVNAGRPARDRDGLHELQGRLFGYRDPERSRLFLERDPLRLVQISDAVWQGDKTLPATEVFLAVNRKREPVVDRQGRLRVSQAEQRGLYQILECVSPWRYRAFSARLNVQQIESVVEKHQAKLPTKRFSCEEIVRACNRFYRSLLQDEMSKLAERGYLSQGWRKAMEALLAGEIGQRLEKGKAWLMRVGRHSGAEAVTLNGVRRIKIRQGQGRSEDASTPKTWWLAASERDQRAELVPFGWLLVEISALGEPLADCLELGEQCKAQLGRVRAWGKQLEGLETRLAQIRAEQAARQQREAEEARLREQRAREEAERQARLAALSPEEQALEEFRAYYEAHKAKGRYQPGGEFDSRRLEFFRQALTWQDKLLRKRVAELIRETLQWSGWPNKKERKQEFRTGLEELDR